MRRFALLALLVAVPVLGGPIRYTLTGTASGSFQIGGVTQYTFTDSPLVWTGVQASTPEHQVDVYHDFWLVTVSPFSMTIGTETYTTSEGYLENASFAGSLGGANYPAGSLVILPIMPYPSAGGGFLLSPGPGSASVGWDLNSPLGPIPVSVLDANSAPTFADMTLDQGTVIFTSVSGLQFQAAAVPEPSTWMLAGLGIAVVALRRAVPIRRT